MVTRTEQIYLPPNPNIMERCKTSNNIYNKGNYYIRKEFFSNRKWLRYNQLYKIMRNEPEYLALPPQTSQQILILLEKSWKSFFKAIKDWKKNPEKYVGRPKLPKFRKRGSQYLLIFTKQQTRFVGNNKNYIGLPKRIGIKTQIRRNIKDKKLIGARILPVSQGYILEILYDRTVPKLKKKGKRIASIDLGLNNLIAMANNIGVKPIIINGRIIKSKNQFFNKEKGMWQSIYDSTFDKTKKSEYAINLEKLQLKRKKQIKDYFHKASSSVIKWCTSHNIDTLVCGYNKGWKQNINIGKRNNQNFVNVPFSMMISQLEYKCENNGINFILTEESYTSKCSFLDKEPLKKQKKYVGRRIHRGLFKSKKGKLINADVNGALNIMKKVFPNAFSDLNSMNNIILHPITLHVIDPKRLKRFFN